MVDSWNLQFEQARRPEAVPERAFELTVLALIVMNGDRISDGAGQLPGFGAVMVQGGTGAAASLTLPKLRALEWLPSYSAIPSTHQQLDVSCSPPCQMVKFASTTAIAGCGPEL